MHMYMNAGIDVCQLHKKAQTGWACRSKRNESYRIVSNLPTQSKTIMRWWGPFSCTNKSIRSIGVADTGQLFSVMVEKRKLHASFVACCEREIWILITKQINADARYERLNSRRNVCCIFARSDHMISSWLAALCEKGTKFLGLRFVNVVNSAWWAWKAYHQPL